MRASRGAHPAQRGLRAWLSERGIQYAWAARGLGYSEACFSRVINGRDPLTDKFKRHCKEVFEVPDDVWLEASK